MKEGVEILEREFGIAGKKLLELGPRSGRMASFFALKGAEVTAVDIREKYLDAARAEAAKWKTKVNFIAYDGNLDCFDDNAFDIVFTKSTLVMIPEQEKTVEQLSQKLKPGGYVLFVENGQAPLPMRIIRTLRHRKWSDKHVRYLRKRELDFIASHFEILHHRKTFFPPLHLIVGRSRK
ncbi:MAG: class I SAM-dependent methyltransferase [Flavobacteriales bacterium]|nr:class I SAM-dependent methyltransferase [Flavobacteriales bacterium]